MSRWIQPSAGILFCVSCVLLCGCASAVLAPKIVTAPNKSQAQAGMFADNPEARVTLGQIYAQMLRVPVGPPSAEIAVGVIEPGDYHYEHTLSVQRNATPGPAYQVNTRWDSLAHNAPRIEPRGTIILLHGFWMNKNTILHWGIHLAQAGYRTIPVDLRGHGASTGSWVTFGAVETDDLKQLLDALQQRGLAGERIGVLGISYGASVALLWAARDPRVATVVALEPFSDARTAIRQYARAMLSPAVNRAISDRSIAAASARAARMAGFRWSDVDVMEAVDRATVPILFVHGEKDTVIPLEHSQRLQLRAPPGSRLITRPEEDHFSLSMQLDGISTDVVEWFRTSRLEGAESGATNPVGLTIPEKHLASP
jgi:pimeloyl-ACP methyl ester carboxylesterase